MTDKTFDKIEKLKKQKNIIAARIQKMEAIEHQKKRKYETRRKILVGSYYLDKAKKENSMNSITSAMDKFLTRNSDRVLFDLPLIKNDNKKQKNK